MKINIKKSFERDVDNITEKKLLLNLQKIISKLENSKSIHEIQHVKKIKGYNSFYRIKIGDYRLGLEAVSNQEVILIRFLNRKEVYRYFPH